MRRLSLLALAAGLLLTAVPAAGQLPPLTVPKRLARFTLAGSFATAESRWLAGQRQPLAQDFVQDSLGSAFWSALQPVDDLLRQITGLPGARLHLGSTTARHQVTVGTGGIGLAYGLTSRITLTGLIPITRVVVRSSIAQSAEGARAGFNPADPVFGDGFGLSTDALFFGSFDRALAGLDTALTRGDYDGNPGQKTLAEQTLAAGRSLRGNLFSLLLGPGTASPFLPTKTSAEGAALLGRITDLQTILRGLNIDNFSEAPALPGAPLDDAGFKKFATDPEGRVAGSFAAPTIVALGDIELGAAVALVTGMTTRGTGLDLVGQATVRLPTSQLDSPSRFFDLGTGDRQPDVELGLTADAGAGWFGARFQASYNLQMAFDLNRRIARPAEVMPYAGTLAAVTRNPGDVITLSVAPFIRLGPGFGLVFGLSHRRKGEDAVTLLAGQEEIPGAPPGLLAEESARNWTTAMAMLSVASPLKTVNGVTKLPLDGGVAVRRVVNGSGGRTLAEAAVQTWIRLYFRFP
jgi:hypothetical protein